MGLDWDGVRHKLLAQAKKLRLFYCLESAIVQAYIDPVQPILNARTHHVASFSAHHSLYAKKINAPGYELAPCLQQAA
jgi:hypothetical protein